MKKWSFLFVIILLVACNNSDEAQQVKSSESPSNSQQSPIENEANIDSDANGEQDDSDAAENYSLEDSKEIQMAIDNMFNWQSYHANYLFMYDIEGIENYNLIETEYVASPEQIHTIITTPYFEEEYYAKEDVGVFSHNDTSELWHYDENTDLALEEDLIYSIDLMNKIMEAADVITITQDIDSPYVATIFLKEDTDLYEKFLFYLSARTETVQEIMHANVIDVLNGEAYIYYLDNNILYCELNLNVKFEDFSTGVLVIKEEFDRINAIEEILIPADVYAE